MLKVQGQTDPTREVAVSTPSMNHLGLQSDPLNPACVTVNFCSWVSMWVISTSACSVVIPPTCVPPQMVCLVVGMFYFLHTSLFSLTNTFWVCRQRLVIRIPSCSLGTILELGPCSMTSGWVMKRVKLSINGASIQCPLPALHLERRYSCGYVGCRSDRYQNQWEFDVLVSGCLQHNSWPC